MNTLPYTSRESVPLYFFPFLSPLSCKADDLKINDYCTSLQGEKSTDLGRLLYIHIPFCKDLCYFCGFYRNTLGKNREETISRYVEALKCEIRGYAETPYLKNSKISSIYFGGGTPTLLPPHLIESLLRTIHDNFNIESGTELTYEGEVRTLNDKARLSILRELGCNRVSFGVQTFDPHSRKLSGLKPTMNDIMACVNTIKEYGYDINIDLMYGLPGQSEATWESDLRKAIEMTSANIDIYDTVLYPHTILFQQRHKLKNELPCPDARRLMFENGIDILSDAGYIHETIEDFHLPSKGYRMKRLVYGGGDGKSEILAIGASAVGVLNGYSYRNLTPDKYCNWSDNSKLPPELLYKMSDEDFKKRALVFFPKVLVLNKKDIDEKWLEKFRPVIEGMKDRGLIDETPESLKVTKKGLVWSDNMAMEFLDSREQSKIWKIGH